jgi:hypothetical protein
MYHHCETCRVLSNSLEDARCRLEEFSLRVADLACMGSPDLSNADLRELQSLRMEHQMLAAEFESHRAGHQLTEKSKPRAVLGIE